MTKMDKMAVRQNYPNLWRTDLLHTIQSDPPFCCFAFLCGPCASYMLRKRALYSDMSRYTCCGGYMPCSGRCGESHCPEFCLCTETQHKVELDRRDGKFGSQPVMTVPPVQQMSRMDQPVPPMVGYPPPPAYGQPYTANPPTNPPTHTHTHTQGPGYPPPNYPPAAYPR